MGPYQHGTPAGDGHTWVDPGQLACPDCACCSTRLCQQARGRGTSCAIEATDHGDFDLSTCPCAPRRTAL